MYFGRVAILSALCASTASAFTLSPQFRGVSNKALVSSVSKYDVSRKMSATVSEVESTETFTPMRPPINMPWSEISSQLVSEFGYTPEEAESYSSALDNDKDALLKLYKAMNMARAFENACNQAYMQGKIRGFMHLDNGQESIPGLVDYAIKNGDKKYSYYREHTHAIASGVSPAAVMAELMMKDTGTCRGAGGSMHIFDKPTYFQGGWALVSEQLPYAAGAAKSILIERALGLSDNEKQEKNQPSSTRGR
jgi:hypothetical protein